MDTTILRAGMALGELMGNTQSQGVTLRYATVDAVNETSGYWTVDISLSGAELSNIPITTACMGVRVGDRVVVEEYGNQCIVTGVVARPNALTGPDTVFSWSSTFNGSPTQSPYTEKTQTINHRGGLLLCEVAAAVSGTGEYGLAFDFVDSNGKTVAHWGATSPQKNGGTLRWVSTGTVKLPAGAYKVTLTSSYWGTVSIVGTDSSGNSRKWRDSVWGTDGVPRYARITML